MRLLAVTLLSLAGHAAAQSPSDVLSRDFYGSTLKAQVELERFIPPGSVIIVGDSIIQNLEPVPVGAVRFGIGGDTTAGVLHRLPQYAVIGTARAVVLQSGINDLGFGAKFDAAIPRNYRKMLRKIPDATPVYIVAILPVNEPLDKTMAGYNLRIAAINKAVARVCRARPACVPININAALRDRSGNLIARFARKGDPVHLNENGYRVLTTRLASELGVQPVVHTGDSGVSGVTR